jgi:hypothetical protein
MSRRKKVEITPTKFFKFPEVTLPGDKIVERGEIIKISGEHGMRFKFDSLVTNTETGAQWIDCFEVHKMRTGCLRSFTADRIRKIPVRRRRRRAARNTDG